MVHIPYECNNLGILPCSCFAPASDTHLRFLSSHPGPHLRLSRSFQCYFSGLFNDTELNVFGFIVASTYLSVFKENLTSQRVPALVYLDKSAGIPRGQTVFLASKSALKESPAGERTAAACGISGQRERTHPPPSQPQPRPEGGAGSEGRCGPAGLRGRGSTRARPPAAPPLAAAVIGVSSDQSDGRSPPRKAGVAAQPTNRRSCHAVRVPAGGGGRWRRQQDGGGGQGSGVGRREADLQPEPGRGEAARQGAVSGLVPRGAQHGWVRDSRPAVRAQGRNGLNDIGEAGGHRMNQ